MRCLDEWMARCSAWLPRGLLVHLASSHATVRDPASHRGMIRVGLAWTGLVDDEWGAFAADDGLESVVRWTTSVVQAKRVPAGTPVGYGSTWCSPRDTVIALLPVGYADGYPSPKPGLQQSVRIHARGAWHTVPVVGAVNMDQLTVDAGSIVGSWGAPQELFGAPVELLGTDRRHVTHPLEVARVAGRKPYEILCGLSSRLPRVHEGALVIDRSARSVSVPRAAAASPDAGE
jgi:alanine racemase